jgi:hypothetical protein
MESYNQWLTELTAADMAALSGGVGDETTTVTTPPVSTTTTPSTSSTTQPVPPLTRTALNRWLFKFRTNTLNIPRTQERVTKALADAANGTASLSLSNNFFSQLADLRGNNRLGSRFYSAIGLPIP